MSVLIISDSQKEFLKSSIQNGIRIDGRSNGQPQKYTLKINNLNHLLGSCLLNLEHSQNQVHIYTGIKIKVQKTSGLKKQSQGTPSRIEMRRRVCLQLGCIKKLSEQQQQVRLYMQEYLQMFVVDKFLNEFQSLLTIPKAKRHYLTINIDSYILATPHISYLEYLHLCIKTAIQNIQMPQLDVAFNEITDEEIIDVRSSSKDQQSPASNQPPIKDQPYIGLSSLKIVGVMGDNLILGMTVEQYEAVESCLLIALDQQKNVVCLQSLKGTTKVEQLHQIIKFAKQ